MEDYKGIVDILKKHPKVNFISLAITPWHALSIEAAILSLRQLGCEIIPVVIIAEHEKTGWAIDNSYFKLSNIFFYKHPVNSAFISYSDNDNVANYTIWDKIKDAYREYKFYFDDRHSNGEKRSIWLCDPNYPSLGTVQLLYSLGYHVILTTTEEGAGSYMGTVVRQKWPQLKSRKDIFPFRMFLRRNIIGIYLLKHLHENYTSRIFFRKCGRLKINKSILPFYREVFALRNNISCKNINRESFRNSILICTTAWEREKIIDNEDLNVLTKVCHYLKSKGYNLILKTHPRDKFFEGYVDELCCELLDSVETSTECLLNYAQPKAIVGLSSTSLVTANIFWNTPAFSISDMLDRSKIGKIYLEETDQFKKTFARYTIFVSKLTDFSF